MYRLTNIIFMHADPHTYNLLHFKQLNESLLETTNGFQSPEAMFNQHKLTE